MQKIETHNHPVVLYGAGHNAKARFHELTSEIPNIVCFCDRDESKYGTLYCGLPVFSWEETVARYPDCLIYVTAVVDGDRKEIASRLTSLGVSGERLLNVGVVSVVCSSNRVSLSVPAAQMESLLFAALVLGKTRCLRFLLETPWRKLTSVWNSSVRPLLLVCSTRTT